MVSEGVQPLGQYNLDSYDGYTSVLGGELMVLVSNGVGSDGYQVISARPARTTDSYGPFYLSDDGNYGYGQSFGAVVTKTSTGFAGGLDSAIRLGPASYLATGKVTLWDKPGLYAVTLDALDPTVTQTTWMGKVPGAKLTVMADNSGRLTTGTQTMPAVATVVHYKVDESLVTTGGAVVAKQKLVIRFNPFGSV